MNRESATRRPDADMLSTAYEFEAVGRVLGCIVERNKQLRSFVTDYFPNFSDQTIVAESRAEADLPPTLQIRSSGNNETTFSFNLLYFPQLERKLLPYQTVVNLAALQGKLTSEQAQQITSSVSTELHKLFVAGSYTSLSTYSEQPTPMVAAAEPANALSRVAEAAPPTRRNQDQRSVHAKEGETREERLARLRQEFAAERSTESRRQEAETPASRRDAERSRSNQPSGARPNSVTPNEHRGIVSRVFPTNGHAIAFALPVAAATVASVGLGLTAIENITFVNKLSYSITGMGEQTILDALKLLSCTALPGAIGGSYLGGKLWSWWNNRTNRRESSE